MSFCHHCLCRRPVCKLFIFSSSLKPLQIWTKPGRDGPWVGPFQNCVRQPRPPFKMAAVTKNRNFFNCPLLLYYPLANEVAKAYSNATVLPSIRLKHPCEHSTINILQWILTKFGTYLVLKKVWNLLIF